MENSILVTVRPFVMEQEVAVYMDDIPVEVIKCNLNEIEEAISTLSNKFHIYKVDISGGNQIYCSKIKENLATKYSFNDIDIVVH